MKTTNKICGFLLVMISIFALCSCATTSETSNGSVITETSYDADLKVTDANGLLCGQMDVTLNMSAGYSLTGKGSNSPKLDLETSGGEAFWLDSRIDTSKLVN